MDEHNAVHLDDLRGNQALVDARAGGCASRARLPGVRSSAAGGRYHCRSPQVREDIAKRTGSAASARDALVKTAVAVEEEFATDM
jgi:hypothetical protein